MSQPTPYTPNADFSQQEANNASGRSTVNTAALDAEFAAIETTLDQTLANIQLLQRDDGKLSDLLVEVHTLSPEVLNLIGGLNLTGLWVEGRDYAVGDISSNGAYTYVCNTAHTSTAIFDDSKWDQFGFTSGADAAQAAANAQVSANAAAASATNASNSAIAADASADSADASEAACIAKAAESLSSANAAASSETNASNSAAAAAASAASITLPIPVVSGGTGATTQANARTNLGISAANTPNTPAGNIAATTVQAALNELDAEKASIDSPSLTGTPLAPTAAAGTNTTQIATTEFVITRTPNASETAVGLIELATAAEAQAMSDAVRALSPARLASAFGGENQSLAASGYQKLPSGLIIQWGVIPSTAANTSVTVTYPVAFTTATAQVVPATSGTVATDIFKNVSATGSQATFRNTSGATAQSGSYIAIGY